MYEDEDFGLLVGKTLTDIDVSDEEVLFVCNDDSAFRAYHMQDCCESVYLARINGDAESLVGETIVESEDIILDEWPDDEEKPSYLDSWTWTYHRVKTDSGKIVVFKWLGQSNGYYSESVYLTRTHQPIN